MKRSNVFLIVGLSFLLVSAVQAETTLEVTPEAALGGSNFGLEVQYDGVEVSRTFVLDDSPQDEGVYRFSFRADLNDFDSAEGDVFYIATVRSSAPNNIIRAWIRKRTDGSGLYQLRMICRRDSGSSDNRWSQVGGAGFAGDSTWTFEWTQATAGMDNGACRVFKNGTLRGEITNGDWDERSVDNFLMGNTNTINVSGTINTSTTGTYYLDTFESFRTLAPPPAP